MRRDPEHPAVRDELERRGDSLLDEERWRRDQVPGRMGCDVWDVVAGDSGTVWVRLAGNEGWVGYSPQEAVGLGHAILSMAETIQREEAGDAAVE